MNDLYRRVDWRYVPDPNAMVEVEPDEYVRRRDVCICALGEGFDPQPSDLHNSWCSYEPERQNDESG